MKFCSSRITLLTLLLTLWGQNESFADPVEVHPISKFDENHNAQFEDSHERELAFLVYDLEAAWGATDRQELDWLLANPTSGHVGLYLGRDEYGYDWVVEAPYYTDKSQIARLDHGTFLGRPIDGMPDASKVRKGIAFATSAQVLDKPYPFDFLSAFSALPLPYPFDNEIANVDQQCGREPWRNKIHYSCVGLTERVWEEMLGGDGLVPNRLAADVAASVREEPGGLVFGGAKPSGIHKYSPGTGPAWQDGEGTAIWAKLSPLAPTTYATVFFSLQPSPFAQ